MSNATIYQFGATGLAGAVVDRENGIVKGVSVITGNVQAKGHKLEVDRTTVQQMYELGLEKEQVPVKWNHGSGADAVNGFLTNFRIEGEKLRADWHLLKTHEKFDQALELAERMPQNVGFSTSFAGQPELKDGTKVYNPDVKTKCHYTLKHGARVPVPKTEKMFARCEELVSVDLVATPAANPDGMFGAKVDSGAEGMADKPTPGIDPEKQEDVAKILLGEFRQFTAGMNDRITRLEELVAQDPDEALTYFERRLDKMASEQERREFEAAQATLERNFSELVEVNEQLVAENEILALAYKELSEKTKSVVEFSPGKEGDEPRAVVRQTNGKKLTDFEKRVDELKREGKDAAEALTFAVDEDTDRYAAHLQAKGAFTQTL
jgi:hypothetical protein